MCNLVIVYCLQKSLETELGYHNHRNLEIEQIYHVKIDKERVRITHANEKQTSQLKILHGQY